MAESRKLLDEIRQRMNRSARLLENSRPGTASCQDRPFRAGRALCRAGGALKDEGDDGKPGPSRSAEPPRHGGSYGFDAGRPEARDL